MEHNLRPFDILLKAKEKVVVVELKNEAVIEGKLEAFDTHLNLVLSNAKEISKTPQSEETCDMVIRGDAIVTIKNI